MTSAMLSCTLVAELERETRIPIYDTVATAVWHSLQLVGLNTGRIEGLGRLFSMTQTGQAVPS